MTKTDDLTTVRLSGRPALLATVPALLGFHPTASLVLLGLVGERRRVGPVVRADLDDHTPGLAAYLAGHAARYADEAIVLAYCDSADPPALLADVIQELRRRKIPVFDSLIVRDGQAWPAEPDTKRPQPPVRVPPTDGPEASRIAAALALHGRAVLPDRQALARSVAGPTGEAALDAISAFLTAADELIELIESTGPGGPDPLLDLAIRTARTMLRESETGTGPDLATSARLALLLSDRWVRDEMIVLALRELDESWLPMLIAAATRIPDREAVELCTMLAMLAYRHGDGALAQIVADRVLAVDRNHRLIGILLDSMAAGLPPSSIGEMADTGPWAVDDLLSPGTD